MKLVEQNSIPPLRIAEQLCVRNDLHISREARIVAAIAELVGRREHAFVLRDDLDLPRCVADHVGCWPLFQLRHFTEHSAKYRDLIYMFT